MHSFGCFFAIGLVISDKWLYYFNYQYFYNGLRQSSWQIGLRQRIGIAEPNCGQHRILASDDKKNEYQSDKPSHSTQWHFNS